MKSRNINCNLNAYHEIMIIGEFQMNSIVVLAKKKRRKNVLLQVSIY